MLVFIYRKRIVIDAENSQLTIWFNTWKQTLKILNLVKGNVKVFQLRGPDKRLYLNKRAIRKAQDL
jgi:general stress protein 26